MPVIYSMIALTISFGIVLHHMAKRRGLNPVFWGVMGLSFWFLALPFLMFAARRGKRDPATPNNHDGANAH